jgi:flagellar motor switch protein FliM
MLEPPGGAALLTLSPELLMMVIDRSFGGQGHSIEYEPRALTQIERKVANRMATSLLNSLETAWETAAPIEIRDVSFESNPEFIRIAAPSDPTIVLAFEVNARGVTGQIHLCYPLTTLDPVLSKLAPRRPVQRSSSAKRQAPPVSRAALANVQVPLVVELANGHVSLQDLSDLREGDVLKLDTAKNEPAVVIVGERPKFLGRPGLNGKKRVVKITTCISAAEEEKYQ